MAGAEPSPVAVAPEASPFVAPPEASPLAARQTEAPSPFAAPLADPAANGVEGDSAADAAVAAELAAFAPSAAVAVTPLATDGTTTAPFDYEVTSADELAAPSPRRGAVASLLGSRRNLAIAAGGALVLVVSLVFALGGSDDKPTRVASKSKPTERAKDPAPEPVEVEHANDPSAEAGSAEGSSAEAGSAEAGSAEEAAGEVPSADTPEPPTDTSGSAATVTSSAATATRSVATPKPAATGPRPVAPKKTLGGKQLVLEYDSQASTALKPVPAAAKVDQAAIDKARGSYAAGNQRLLAGDWNGAIMKYRQSLAHYPGYVAGYRGLGLAFMQLGDKPKALQALRLYISSVPNAKDAPLIRKRIATLQSQMK